MKALIRKLENYKGDKVVERIMDVKDDTPEDKDIGLGRRTRESIKRMQSHSKEIEDIKRVVDNMEQMQLEVAEMLQKLT